MPPRVRQLRRDLVSGGGLLVRGIVGYTSSPAGTSRRVTLYRPDSAGTGYIDMASR